MSGDMVDTSMITPQVMGRGVRQRVVQRVALGLVVPMLATTVLACTDALTPSRDELLTAPTELTLGSHSYVLETFLWRNFTPSSDELDRSLHGAITVRESNGATIPDNVSVVQMWALNEAELWEADLEDGLTGAETEIRRVAHGGPLWDTGTLVTVVVEVRAGSSRGLLRVDDQEIRKVS